ncbi:MAG: hypothetical protein FWF75_04490 [Propionibacteriaceae bacterium]|nr:hypothetical protein [Propionibacteriaceae bacterium]
MRSPGVCTPGLPGIAWEMLVPVSTPAPLNPATTSAKTLSAAIDRLVRPCFAWPCFVRPCFVRPPGRCAGGVGCPARCGWVTTASFIVFAVVVR